MQMDPQIKLLLENLYGEDFLKIGELVRRLQVSEKTVRSLLNRLDELLSENGGEIQRRYGEGYRLQIHDQEAFDRFLEQQQKQYVPGTGERRAQYMAAELILTGDFLKVEELCDRFFVSRKTITSDLKQTERILGMFDLTLERRPRYGIQVKGGEFSCRQCLAFLLRRSGSHLYRDVSCQFMSEEQAAKILAEALNTGSYEIYDVEFSELVLQFRLGLYRYQKKRMVELAEFDDQDFLQEKDIATAERCAGIVEKSMGIVLPVAEIK